MSEHPHFGFTERGLAVHADTMDHLPSGGAMQRFNARLAVRITSIVGSMWCAYAFALFDMISLPEAIGGGAQTIVAWVAQTFLQLVLLSVIMVGQNVQAAAADARSAKTFEDVEQLLALARDIKALLAPADDAGGDAP
jgi:hypothetical protein